MNIKYIQDKKEWDKFLNNKVVSTEKVITTEIEQKTFLHSWQWGLFNYQLGIRNYQLGIYYKDELIGVALVLKIIAKRGTFLFIPHGPIIKVKIEKLKVKSYELLLNFLKNLVRQENCSFIRISPILEDNEKNQELFKKLGFKSAPAHMHSECNWIVNINKSEEEILSGMRKTTRNLIRQAIKNKELQIINYESKYKEQELDDFYFLYQETFKRQGFSGFTKNYFQKELEAFGDDAKIFLVKYAEKVVPKYENKILAGAIVIFLGDTAYYHHAASTHSKLPATYLMNWEIIREAKKRGCKYYNMWGVSKENDKKHPWSGLSLFKRGFGGKELNLMRAQDLPLNKVKYFINWVIEKIRTKKRRY